mmetsp:Transcript_99711/g.121949  ORF Transcript_99711/g.121949 Transcript_99711/m.121949 type:complete len:289 (-) Transcript_99711:104-970(-)
MGQTASNSPYFQTCSHLGICDPNMNTVRVDFPLREDTPGLAAIGEKRDAQLIPTSRVMRKALARQKDGHVDRGMLAKAEWERQLRAKLEQREKERAEAVLDAAAGEAKGEGTALSVNDERQKALDAIQQDLFGGRLCDRSHIPVLREEDETSTEDEQPTATATTGRLGSCKKLSQETAVASVSQYSTQATEGGPASEDEDSMVSIFLEKHGFRDVNCKKRRFLRSTYPLHLAVAEGNGQLVKALLAKGAKKEQKNSVGMTAEEIARKSNKDGSHREVLEALGVPTPPE